LLIYTWSVANRGSLDLGQEIGSLNPPNTAVVGINLDSDANVARAAAATRGLPGELIFAARSENPELVQALRLDGSGTVYLADAQGVLRDLSAQRSLTSAFVALTTTNP
jgi:hypothetical protein